ncbi:hypothetical protein CR164_12745 [Prosthecochloris marina]|uniref:Uncharacterized protein n=1 Tax=Prosthecochloris marina TaxID=2017681 RepID=A0A317T597_9CHLB|nr:hypothetical protein CR164_12745 [Prosthecochloris marina]
MILSPKNFAIIPAVITARILFVSWLAQLSTACTFLSISDPYHFAHFECQKAPVVDAVERDEKMKGKELRALIKAECRY